MTTMKLSYDIPNIGCLLGIAYQTETARLNSALSEADIDITAAEYLILRTLYSYGPIQQCEISKTLGKDKASINRSIHSLVKKGLISADTISYKCSIISLTPEGTSLKSKLIKIGERAHNRLSARISKQQMETLREILELIIK